MTFDDIFKLLDKDALVEAIKGPEGSPSLPTYEFSDVKEMVLRAGDKWLLRDLKYLSKPRIEKEGGDRQELIGGWKDGELVSKVWFVIDFLAQDDKGTPVVVDWKTSQGALDLRWANRLLDSWQWKITVTGLREHVTSPPRFVYRGINRACETREVEITYDPQVTYDMTVRQAGQYLKMREILRGDLIWPMNMPSSCGAYGRECRYIEDCKDGGGRPGLVDIGDHVSYSGMSEFLLCPERFRREKLGGKTDSEDLAFGRAFHQGVAEMWGQAFQLKEEGKLDAA